MTSYQLDTAVKNLTERLRRLELKEARNRPATGVSFTDDGGFYGGGFPTLQDILDAIGAGTLPTGFLRTILGGVGEVQALGTLGATPVLDLANANLFWGTLDQDATFTTVGWTNGKDCQITVLLFEDGTGGWTPTFTGVTWDGGTPTHDTTAGTFTRYVFTSIDGGTTIIGAKTGGGGGSGNFPGDVVPLGSMGATPTLDYAAGTAYTGTLDTNATVDFAGFVNLKDCGITFLVSEDGTGGHTLAFTGVTWLGGVTPTHNDTPSTSEMYAFISFDGGTTIIGGKLGGNPSDDLDAIIAASSGQDIADALAGAAAPDSGNPFATIADVGGGGASLIAITSYDPGGGGSYTTTTSLADVDATNAAVTFTTPASTNVYVKLSCQAYQTTGSGSLSWGIREGGSTVYAGAQIRGDQSTNEVTRLELGLLLTGLSGGSHTLKFAAMHATASYVMRWGNGFGPITLEVWAAP